jgi:hypothetical protein
MPYRKGKRPGTPETSAIPAPGILIDLFAEKKQEKDGNDDHKADGENTQETDVA